jgi:ABC transport system ATP-binding/permease protein
VPAARLLERYRDALVSRGMEVDREALSFSVDFVRLAVRALGLAEPNAAERALLKAPVEARSRLSDAAIELLIDLAVGPEFRGAVDEHALRAFATRFGADAAEALRAEAAEELDLGGFTRRYDTADALLLLDTLFAMTAADGEIERSEVHRLEQAARLLGVDPVLVTALLQKHDPRHAAGDLRWALDGARVVIGRSPACAVHLADPQVASQHAELVRVQDGWRVVDLGSGRPTLVNGRVQASAPFDDRTVLRIGPYTLRLVGDELRGFGERSFAALSVRDLTRNIGDVSLLDGVSFTIFSGEVVALVGPSGSGKTTLLNAINGVAPADTGDVLLDGDNFHALLNADRSMVGIVPQDDLVNPELTVTESLYYSGRLRFSSDVSPAEIEDEADRVLEELDIAHIKDSRIGDVLRRGISGGQRKRVNLGQELMSKSTRLLFLDEPTSGLDPKASQEIVSLVRQLADAGRIVFLVTHDLTPEVMAQVDHLLVLAPGGRLAFFGPPEEATRYFKVPTVDAIFGCFKSRTEPREWAEKFRKSDDFRQYVKTREHLLPLRRDANEAGEPRVTVRRSLFRQLSTLTSRYTKVKLRDRTGLLVLGLQPPVLACVMWMVFPAPTTRMLFMMALSCMWFGMSASVRELISDRVIWQREHRIGVGVAPYVGSKLLVLGTVVALQCAGLNLFLYIVLGMGGEYAFDPVLSVLVSVLTGWVGMAIGIFTSSWWTSSEAAVGTLPLLLIPQITFSSVMVSMRDMEPLAKAFTWVTIQRYAFDAIIKCGEMVAIPTYGRGEWDSQPVNGALYKLGLKFTDQADDIGFTLNQLIAILSGIILVLVAATMLKVWHRARRA